MATKDPLNTMERSSQYQRAIGKSKQETAEMKYCGLEMIGHIPRQDGNHCKVVVNWAPEGKRARGKSKTHSRIRSERSSVEQTGGSKDNCTTQREEEVICLCHEA